ncbi:hypothetical protein [Ulvibacterium marinum]|uniref:hypothetical protein n=1 Tax=Ulvibacterium marinum TaxID=2419782 RepID=UPI0011C493E6|nr:hypothetical protein [Ulvibacterium marinum]
MTKEITQWVITFGGEMKRLSTKGQRAGSLLPKNVLWVHFLYARPCFFFYQEKKKRKKKAFVKYV